MILITLMTAFHYDGCMSQNCPCLFTWLAKRSVLLCMSMLVLISCSPSERVNEPPVVRIASVERLDGNIVAIDLMLTNLNPAALVAKQATLELALDDATWVQWTASVNWLVPSSAREVVQLRAESQNEMANTWLDEVANAQRPSLPWKLTLGITLADDRVLEADGMGFLYRVPGNQNRFR